MSAALLPTPITAPMIDTPVPHAATRRRCAPVDIDALAWAIERGGLVGHEAAIAETLEFATTQPVSRVLLGVLGDTDAPDVVRIRAFGKLALQLSRHRH
ncbi:MAG: hypothetical protein AAGG08_14070 [Actinomycetota bacterium]